MGVARDCIVYISLRVPNDSVLQMYKDCHNNDVCYLFHAVPATIVEYPNSPNVVINDSVTLVCLASGIPLPNITWSREGEGDIVNSSESVILSRVVNATHVTSELTLVATGQQDTGQYNCLADNGIGTDNVSFHLQVVGMKEGYV